MEAIAIIGIGCRFPGASGPEQFWDLIHNGIDAITEVPPDRWDGAALYDSNPDAPGKSTTRWGGFLDHVDQFDPQFFKISRREAVHMDPQHRVLLEVAWEALEDAGQNIDRLSDSQTGVFIGIAVDDYTRMLFRNPRQIDAYANTGVALSIAANRLSYLFNWHGPSVALDTACSSSLVAVHLACQSLRNGEATMALAGGVNLLLSPETTIGFSKLSAMSPDGRCHVFDARANGYVRGEGAGLLVLKPLSQALKDGDRIYATILGSAVNQDGKTNGLTAPNRWAQEEVLRAAYANAGVEPRQVQYIEAHGTGTLLGDPIEVKALGTVLAADRPADQPCMIGSVKSNIGHLETAAGVAGLIKVAMMIQRRTLLPSIHFETPNPHIPFNQLPIRVQQSITPWPAGDFPLAGVSGFSFGGTNAHVVVSGAPQTETERSIAAPPYLLTLSATTPEAVVDLARSYRDLPFDGDADQLLHDRCFAAGVRRTHHRHRLAVVVHDVASWRQRLEAALEGSAQAGIRSGTARSRKRTKVAFVFPGQGSQWLGMGRTLLHQEPAFRASIERLDAAIRHEAGWSLLEQLWADEQHARLHEIDVIQPTLFAIQVSLAALWRSWGITPDAVIGHSMGEIAAAHTAGALSLEDAVGIICRRSKLLRRVSGKGAMAVVELSLEEARTAIAGHEASISIAVSNSPRSTVLSGDPAVVTLILEQIQAAGVFGRLVKVDVASHSPQMDPLRDDLLAALEGLQPQQAALPFYSTVEPGGKPSFDPGYWVRNLREPVLFASGVERLIADGITTFVEISAHPILLPMVEDSLQQHRQDGLVLASMRRGEERSILLDSLGALYTMGLDPDWPNLYPQGGTCVSLPTYPWQRERLWIEHLPTIHDALPSSSSGHLLLDTHIQSAVQPDLHFWETLLSPARNSYFHDHQVQGTVVLPAAAYLDLVASAVQALGAEYTSLEQIVFEQPLVLADERPRRLQVALNAAAGDGATFQVLSRAADERSGSWTRHANGMVRRLKSELLPVEGEPIADTQHRCSELLDRSAFYEWLGEHGLNYGPAFQGVAQIWCGMGEAVGQIRLTPPDTLDLPAYQLYPALLDSCLHVVAAAFRSDLAEANGPLLPINVGRLVIHRALPAGEDLWSRAQLRSSADDRASGRIESDLAIYDATGHLLVEIQGFTVQRIEQQTAARSESPYDRWLYTIEWEAKPIDQPAQNTAQGQWLIFADQGGVAQTLQGQLAAQGQQAILVADSRSGGEQSAGLHRINLSQPEALRELLMRVLGNEQPRGIIHLWSLDAAATEDSDLAAVHTSQDRGSIGVMHLVQSLAHMGWRNPPRLYLLTRGAQAVTGTEFGVDAAQASVWGLGRVIAQEHPQFACTCVDLDPAIEPEDLNTLITQLTANDSEDQIAFRDRQRYVARLVQRRSDQAPTRKRRLSRAQADAVPFRLEIATPGILDQLVLRPISRRAPGPGEIEVQVVAAGLNFLDVLSAMGIRPDSVEGPIRLGGECAGIVVGVGEGVSGFAAGDAVIAVAPNSFGSFVTTRAEYVAHKPAAISYAEAATIPLVFMTALYALEYQGRLRAGESVLIHSASGGTGLAAIQLAQSIGATIFATAGNPDKRAFLHELGIESVMDSRSLAFADQILAQTGGRGVDVVLNSLTGEALVKSLSILAAYGRFLEIGKRDIYENQSIGLWPFQKNLSYAAIDLARMMDERPQFFGSLLQDVVGRIAAGSLKPLPTRAFPISQASDAFRYMAQAQHIGKIALLLDDPAVMIEPDSTPVALRDDSTYLITGGLGGLGLTIARSMVEQGARHLALVGRRGKQGLDGQTSELISSLESQGAQIRVFAADVANRAQVAAMLDEIDRTMPPLRGVIHAAGVLDDATILQQSRERFRTVMAPKVDGAWNLHQLTRSHPLDLFVLFSSVAALLGSPGQGNYAAANAFLDALAHHRRQQGLPALSINWGPWSEVGLAARGRGEESFNVGGIQAIDPAQGAAVWTQIFNAPDAQLGVMSINVRQWRQFYPRAAMSPFLSYLMQADAAGSAGHSAGSRMRQTLEGTPVAERLPLLAKHLGEQLAQVLRLPADKIDTETPLGSLGLDSLMGLELRNRLEASLDLTFPVTALWNYETVSALAVYLAEKMELPLREEAPPAAEPVPSEVPAATEPIAEAPTAAADDPDLEALLAQIAAMSLEELSS
jgi:acyl transferase domain-containing protein/acyl carrier protein